MLRRDEWAPRFIPCERGSRDSPEFWSSSSHPFDSWWASPCAVKLPPAPARLERTVNLSLFSPDPSIPFPPDHTPFPSLVPLIPLHSTTLCGVAFLSTSTTSPSCRIVLPEKHHPCHLMHSWINTSSSLNCWCELTVILVFFFLFSREAWGRVCWIVDESFGHCNARKTAMLEAQIQDLSWNLNQAPESQPFCNWLFNNGHLEDSWCRYQKSDWNVVLKSQRAL